MVDAFSRYLTEVNKIWNKPKSWVLRLEIKINIYRLHKSLTYWQQKDSTYRQHKHLQEPETQHNTSLFTEFKSSHDCLLHKGLW
jgi:hypothetical protein